MRLDLPSLAVVQLHPVVLAVLDLPSALERLSEELAQVVVIGSILEPKVADVAEVLVELLCSKLALDVTNEHRRRTRKAVAKILDRGRLLLLPDLLVLLLVRRSLQTLPWQPSAQEVHEDVAESLEIITTRLLASKMGVDAHVTRGSRQRLALPIRNVLLRLGVTVLLGHAEVDHVDNIGGFGAGAPNEEVVGLDVPVDQVLLVDGLDP